ncbi:barren [Microthyrium microscopicum]|uniref:Condensin complex subunit 2 n=1 Tax=Microthyrium microscopicum TaxID=703497 RepID=A0A6A6UID2_9PEZI|nr:barren [Microthyrium microscopicum]
MQRRVFSGSTSTPAKSPIKIPLNDDRQEKASRLHNRQAQHELHMNNIKAAAATPLRKRRSLLAQSPRTPADDDEDDGLPSVSGTAVTPMKRVPIMANFEEWMKMATDNKINATNSWNFALIDYFHDMSLLREGDGVNFQRASCTLDGCVKIYTNRVDSVATETGKLLSGLADSNSDRRKGDADAEDDDGDDDGEEGSQKKTRKRAQRTAEATLATSFAQLQLKKMELEFAIDPLFKKASADFDEGGAKGLLLNHLAIDSTGRIVFDSSDDAVDQEENDVDQTNPEQDATDMPQSQPESVDIDLDALGAAFFPDLTTLDEQDICPSLKTFELGETDASMDLPFLKAPEDWRQDSQTGAGAEDDPTVLHQGDADGGAFDDDDNILGGFDLADGIGFGEGGEVWAKEAALDPQMRVHVMQSVEGDDPNDDVDGEGLPGNDRFSVSMRMGGGQDQQNILDYFDKALQKNWAGPEHWKIRRVKDAAKAAVNGPTKRKEKEPFEIDFAAPMSQALADALYTPAAANSAISLPKTQWRSRTRNLLPDDKHFSSRQLLTLFLKPKAILGVRNSSGRKVQAMPQVPEGEIDEQYWAQQEGAPMDGQDDVVAGNYDANFFQDDGFGAMGGAEDDDDEFADARDHFSPAAGEALANGEVGGSQDAPGNLLLGHARRNRPEYVQYARVATKVDVRRLKEEIWKGLALEEPEAVSVEKAPPVDEAPLMFTDVINNLQTVYPKQAMADISTSFCFICVLHLANEKGLVIKNHEDFQQLSIRKDHTAEIAGID